MRSVRRTIDRFLERRQIEAPEREIGEELRWAHARRFGDFTLAYSAAAEPYLKTFGDERGFIAYGQKMGITFALGDPVAGPGAVESLVDDFLGVFGRAVFVQVGSRMADLLEQRGYRLNEMGYDTIVDLKSHSFAGHAGKRFRYATTWLAANGFSIREESGGSPAAVGEISRKWLKTRIVKKREIRFLNRPFEVEAKPDVRRFFLVDAEGAPCAFVSFDPIYRDGAVIGYLASNKRYLPGSSVYAEMGIIKTAMEAFKREGREVLHLGMSPFADIERGPYREDKLLRLLMQHAYRAEIVNRKLFNLQGIAAYKRRYRGREIRFYLALPGFSNMTRLIALLRLCRVI